MLSVLVSCGGDEPIDPTPVTPVTPVNPPTPEKDTTAPTITVSKSTINVISSPSLTVSGNELKIGNDIVASWKDDKSTACTVTITFVAPDGTSKTVNSGDKLSEEGKLKVKVSDEAGNSSTGEIKLTLSDTKAPVIELKIQEKNVVAGVKVAIQDNQLLFDQNVVATWKDDYTEDCTIELALIPSEGNQRVVNSGETIIEPGKLSLQVTDDFQNKAMAEITLTATAITGLENLQNLSLQVNQAVNLLDGLTISEGLSLDKVEVEQDGAKSVIPDAKIYSPEYPGTVHIILTLSRPDGSTIEVKAENLAVKPLVYDKLTVIDLKPVDIMPIIGQVETGAKDVYSYIEHLRVAEATKIIDMMWEYGASGHTREAYRKLMGRLYAGMTLETPE